ncbi:hypothetical protein [Spongiibacter sp.]|uniref:hypothetical protein n=1 Tax=Spongiibacter sp. TaxID=2024860 RepID=UPI00257FA434|nr:hypothetical protein [Spongiibacter sp.]
MKSYHLTEEPVGLPDSEIFNGGKFALTGFTKTLGIDKSKLGKAKKVISRINGPRAAICPSSIPISRFVNYYSTPSFRLHTLVMVIKSGKDSWHEGNYYSWDKAVIEQYAPDFFKSFGPLTPPDNVLNSATTACSSAVINRDVEQDTLELDAEKRKYQADVKDVLPKFDAKLEQLLEMVDKDSCDWENLSEERRHLAAMVLWSLGTLRDVQYLNDVLAQKPHQFLPYYEKILKKQNPEIITEIDLETPEETAEALKQAVADINLDDMTIAELCDEVTVTAEGLRESPKDAYLSKRLLSIATAVIEKQKEDHVLSSKQISALYQGILELFPFLYAPAPMSDLVSLQDVTTLVENWICWSKTDGKDLAPEAVVDCLKAAVAAVEADVYSIDDLDQKLKAIKSECEVLMAAPEPENIREKRSHKNAIAKANAELAAVESELGDLSVDVYEKCMPEGPEYDEGDRARAITLYPRDRGLALIKILPDPTPDEYTESLDAEPASTAAPGQDEGLVGDGDSDSESETGGELNNEITTEIGSDSEAEMAAEQESEPEPEPEHEPETEPEPEPEFVKDIVEQVTTRAHTDIGQACLDALEQDAFIPGEKINDLFNENLLQQQTNYAAQLAYSLEETQLSADYLPWQLFKAAYYGVNTFDNRYAFSKAQRLLNGISPSDVDAWSHLRHAEAVPYLAFAAAFQPTVFGGTECTGHLLLDSLPSNLFDRNTASLISETSDMARRGEKMTLALLREVNSDGGSEPAAFDPTPVSEWKKKILTATRGYAPIRKAQAVSLESGLFKKITDALINNKQEEYGAVESFVKQYSTREETSQLLDELLDLAGLTQSEAITRVGLSSFHQKVSALAGLAREWLSFKRQAHSDKAEDYARRFITRLQSCIAYFDDGSKTASSAGARAGMAYLAATLTRLLKATRGEATKQSYGMVKGWYYHPRQKMRLESGIESDRTSEAVRWLIGNAGIQLESRQAYEAALGAGRVHMAEVIRHRLNLMGAKIESSATKRAFEVQRKEFVSRCNDLESKVETAGHSGLLDDKSPHWYLTRLEEVREELESFDGIYNIDHLEAEVNEIEADLRFKTASLKESLQTQYINKAEELRRSVPDAIPQSWVESIERALQEDNLPVVQEMLEDLLRHVERGERMRPPEVKYLPVLPKFVARQEKIYKFVMGKSLRREVLNEVHNGGGAMGLDMPATSVLKKPLHAMDELQGKKPTAGLTQTGFEQIAAILFVAGISMVEPTFSAKKDYRYKVGYGTSSAQFYLKSPESRRPFPIFGERRENKPWTVISVHQIWTVDNVRELLQNQMVPTINCIMISMVPVSPELRNEFAQYCKQAQRTIFLLDPVSLIFLASVDNEALGTSDTEKFLWLTAPYTYFNPYVGRTASPPEPEMLFGREHEISSLLDMTSGAAIVYGGRQLGKSTILLEVQRRFHKPPQKHYAFYEQLDKELCANKSHEAHSLEVAKREVWGRLYKFLLGHKVITTPVGEQTPEEFEKAVHDAIVERKDCHIIALFDEIDPILEIDASHSFKIFRALRSLMRHPEVQGRFKMIIGGLANTKRFEENPNYPLSQIGSSIQVTIMPSREATHLVTEPIQAAGYQFESPDVVNAILASTNRHPGLIQILCNQLLTTVGRNANSPVGDTFITKENVRSALNVPEVLETIRERFEMTLNLDKRYLVMVYSILSEGAGSQSFSVKEAKKLATSWAPEVFGSDSDGQFKHFLNELVGLGVLRELDSGRFELRNSSVRKLLSETNMLDVDNKLLQVIEDMNQMDPMDYRPFDSSTLDAIPRPMTFRDQKAITGMASEEDKNKLGSIRAQLFTSTLIIGSDAQGLGDIRPTMPGLFDMENTFFDAPANLNKYTTHDVSTGKYKTPAEFEKNLSAVIGKAEKLPQMVVVTIEPETEISLLLGLIDAADNLGGNAKKIKMPVRVLFLMGPQAYWKWLQARELTAGREEAMSIIHLSRWKRCAINMLLEQLEMVDSANAVYEIEKATGGWHYAMKNMITLKREKKNISKLKDFGRDFPLPSLRTRNARRFLEEAGVPTMPWAMPLLTSLAQASGDFDKDDFMLALMEQDGLADVSEVEATAHLNWLRDMNLLTTKSTSGKDSKRKLTYALPPEIKHMVEVLSGEETTVD